MKEGTKCVQEGYTPANGAPRVLPLYQSTTFAYDTPEQLAQVFDLKDPGYMYSRLGNPTCGALEKKVAALEGGAAAISASSGMSAILMAVTNVCSAGDNIISYAKIYGGTFNLFNVTLRRLGIECRFIDAETSAEEIEKLIDDKTRLVYGESLANPGMDIFDYEKIVPLCRKHGVLLFIDNTLTTPVLHRPFEWGADVVVHSTTKYMDGHASSLGGMVVCSKTLDFTGNPRYPMFTTPDESYHGMVYQTACGSSAFVVKIRAQMLRDLGCCMSPFNAYLTNMGMETMHLRMKAHSENAAALAQELQKCENVEWVRYPALVSDPVHAMAEKYFNGGCSGMITFGIKGGRSAANKFMKALKLAKIVTHIADVRTCVLHPATTTHRQLSDEQLIEAGVPDNLIRVSVGIEDREDIIADMLQALQAAK